jgi:hypothetical protein
LRLRQLPEYRAPLAMQTDRSKWLEKTSLDADLQRVISAWDLLPAAIRRAIIALTGLRLLV